MLPSLIQLNPNKHLAVTAPTAPTAATWDDYDGDDYIPGKGYPFIQEFPSESAPLIHRANESELYVYPNKNAAILMVSAERLAGLGDPALASALAERARWLAYRISAGRHEAAYLTDQSDGKLIESSISALVGDANGGYASLSQLGNGDLLHVFVETVLDKNDGSKYLYFGAYNKVANTTDVPHFVVSTLANRYHLASNFNSDERLAAEQHLAEVASKLNSDVQRSAMARMMDF